MSTSTSQAWFRRYRPASGARMRLVCLPHGGGGASFFRCWALAVPPAVETLSVQYPGREDRAREPAVEVMSVLADEIAVALDEDGDLPIALFGHSMGAAVAFEVARLLETRGRPAVRLFVSGRGAPQLVRPATKHLLDDSALWDDVLALGGTHETLGANAELRALVLPTLRSDYRLIETYRLDPLAAPLQTPITGFVGAEDPEAPVDDVASWSQQTRSAFELRVFPGHHFYLVEQRRRVLDEVLALLAVDQPRADWPSAP